jgi:hypothetical protein
MAFDLSRARVCLQRFDLKKLFIEEMGWDHHSQTLSVNVDGQTYLLSAVAQKRGMVVFLCKLTDDRKLPDYSTRRKIERQVTRSVHEHLLIFIDSSQSSQLWQWVKREPGKPTACREHSYSCSQPGDALLQKCQSITFSFEEEESLALPGVTGRAREAFDVDRVTKRFYERFKAEHEGFSKFLKGIPDEDLQRWYVSVMLNRLMFIYFIQKKGFLDNDIHYLRNKLGESRKSGKDRFYSHFLCPLFFEGFAKTEGERSADVNRLLGKVPYLNGGLFLRHQIEELHGRSIQIPDAAFEKLFAFFDQYHWHLDERPVRADNEINPDVLGYIFEKYVNQKQMGAYYTKEDITEYISKNTIIPFLFDSARKEHKASFDGEKSLWQLPQADPDRYIYDAMKKGMELPLPEEISQGLDKVSKRTEWNKPASPEYALPTEIWREVVARRQRCQEVRGKLAKGEIREIDDLITYNLNIRQFAQDVIVNSDTPELLRAFWHAIEKITVLDPTCGSGAFLFAALNILEPLYEACLQRMESFLADLERSGEKHRPENFSDFRKVLDRVSQHPNTRYFILKSIIINNLFGVDIMEEATEICKLRLFLKMVAQVESADHIEPLPDIDFNIRAGNTLVGFTSVDDVKKAMEGDMIKLLSLPSINEKAEITDRAFQKFRQMQTEQGMDSKDFWESKIDLQMRLKKLEDELDQYLAKEYGIDLRKKADYEKWLTTHKPFHWFIEFYGIIKHGGFDAIIGNPPYVLYAPKKVNYEIKAENYITFPSKNLYSFIFERSIALGKSNSNIGLIVQLTVLSSERIKSLQDLLINRGSVYSLSFPRRPEAIFEGVEMPVAIVLSIPDRQGALVTSRINRFYTEERPFALAHDILTRHTIRIDGYRIAKIGLFVEKQIFWKLKNSKQILESLSATNSRWVLYYQEACRYWVKASKGYPFFKRNGISIEPPHGRLIHFQDNKSCVFAVCLVNSSLFYWFYSIFSDCEHINDNLIRRFQIPGSWDEVDWQSIHRKLEQNISDNSHKKTINTRKGHVIEYVENKLGYSKPVIDEIDYLLAQQYGLDDEELDFVKNYDIKYRMGRDGNEETED